MFLTIDIGNTNVTLGVYEGERLGADWRVGDRSRAMPDEYGLLLSRFGAPRHAGEGIQASRSPAWCRLTGTFREMPGHLRQEPLVVDAGIKTGVRVRYENPREVGADRVVNCAAVQA